MENNPNPFAGLFQTVDTQPAVIIKNDDLKPDFKDIELNSLLENVFQITLDSSIENKSNLIFLGDEASPDPTSSPRLLNQENLDEVYEKKIFRF